MALPIQCFNLLILFITPFCMLMSARNKHSRFPQDLSKLWAHSGHKFWKFGQRPSKYAALLVITQNKYYHKTFLDYEQWGEVDSIKTL